MLINRQNVSMSLITMIGASVLLTGGVLASSLSESPLATERMSQGAAFTVAPRLTHVTAINTEPGSPGTYYFTISMPKEARQSLEAVRVTQLKNEEPIVFEMSQSNAYLGDRLSGGTPVSLANIGGSESLDGSEALVAFDHPITPGSTVTIALHTNRNPMNGGIYQFGITAYPVGRNSTGLYLGTGRVTLHQR
jgi:hypothetical protein